MPVFVLNHLNIIIPDFITSFLSSFDIVPSVQNEVKFNCLIDFVTSYKHFKGIRILLITRIVFSKNISLFDLNGDVCFTEMVSRQISCAMHSLLLCWCVTFVGLLIG